ncbi:MAG: GDSL-type esterase/lipase family protein [Bacteroidota bacterium]
MCWIATWQHSQAQPLSSAYERYAFLRGDINLIDNNFRGLQHFYHQLSLLENGRRQKVNIVHIGDSHIQADWFSGRLRMALQKQFGAAGRGLVFPYQVARTNSPDDLFTSSNVKWEVQRNIGSQSSLPTGVSGISLRTQTPHFILKVGVGDNPFGIDYTFDRVGVFTEKGRENFQLYASPSARAFPGLSKASSTDNSKLHEVRSGENLTEIAAKYNVAIDDLITWNRLAGSTIYAGKRLIVEAPKGGTPTPARDRSLNESVPLDFRNSAQDATRFLAQTTLPRAVSTVYLRGKKEESIQRQTVLYGLVLENSQRRGILYHNIGVNGAKFSDFNRGRHFMQQVGALEPDLIIVSLGTNEAANRAFGRRAFYQAIDEMIYQINQYAPHAAILFTTPPDAYYARQRHNSNVELARDVLQEYAFNHDLACWNFYDIMGGTDAIQDWHKEGLAQPDHLHLTQEGYELQGDLLFEALIKGYGNYQSAKFR